MRPDPEPLQAGRGHARLPPCPLLPHLYRSVCWRASRKWDKTAQALESGSHLMLPPGSGPSVSSCAATTLLSSPSTVFVCLSIPTGGLWGPPVSEFSWSTHRVFQCTSPATSAVLLGTERLAKLSSSDCSSVSVFHVCYFFFFLTYQGREFQAHAFRKQRRDPECEASEHLARPGSCRDRNSLLLKSDLSPQHTWPLQHTWSSLAPGQDHTSRRHKRAAGGSLRGACLSASRHLSRNGNLVSNEEEGVKNTNWLNQGRELPAGGTRKWLGKVLPFESS